MSSLLNIVINDFTHDSRVLKTSLSLQSIGFDVVVVALHNIGLSDKEVICGIPVHRVKLLSRTWSKLKPIQLLKYFEFFFRVVTKYKDYKLIHCNDLNALPIGLFIKLIGKDVSVIYDCHEYQCETIGLTRLSKFFVKHIERWLIKYADQVITVSNSIANEYVRLYSITKPHVVLNCPKFWEQKKQNLFRDKFGIRSDQLIFLYQGGLSEGRGIDILLNTFSQLTHDRCVLVCMGYGPLESSVQEFAKRSAIIFYHPAVQHSVLLDHTSSADFGILFYEDTCLNHRYCSPNKIFEYLMAGIPVLTSNLFEMRCLVETESVGMVAESNDSKGFMEALGLVMDLDAEEMLSNVRLVRKRYCWEAQEKVLFNLYAKF